MINLIKIVSEKNNLMTTIEMIGLDDLQDLTEFFANLKVVDLMMNTTGGEIPSIYWTFFQ